MDKNELGLDAAQSKMKLLKGTSAGNSWFGLPGLLVMYAKIAGLSMLALVIVFVLPKLRF